MFYKIHVKDHIRVPPSLMGENLEKSMIECIKTKYEGYISKEIGIVIDVMDIKNIEEGVIIPGDGAFYYKSEFDLLAYLPELQEVILGRIKDIADFGAFIGIGPLEGMIHVSQTMDDFVSFSKDKALLGKESKRTVKVNDICRARIIAISYKDITNPKIGITMRQPWLGNVNWIKEELEKTQTRKEEKWKKHVKTVDYL